MPVGATIIPQTRGTAPGLICPVTVDGVDKVVYAVPGVPHEMKEMVERAVLPDLRRRSGDTGVIVSRTLRTWGESESGLNERLDPVISRLDEAGNPTLAFLASGWEGLKVRLTAKAATQAEARDRCSTSGTPRFALVVGEHVFGVDDETMESAMLALLRARGLSLGLAESVTGGLVAGRLTAVPGASDVLRGADRLVRQRGEVRSARRARGPGRQRGRGGGDGHRCPTGARRRRGLGADRRRRPGRAGRHAGRHAVRRHRRRHAGLSPAPSACPVNASRCAR